MERDDEELERLKRQADLLGMVRAHGVKLRRAGADWLGLCPFHAEETPSFRVTPGKNLWHCFGCGRGGSAIDWLMAARRIELREALDLLRGSLPGRPPRRDSFQGWEEATDQDLLWCALEHYAGRVGEVACRRYLERRGLWDEETLSVFRLGFADRTLGFSIPDKQTRPGLELRSRLQGLGILRESGHEHLNGSLVVPILGAEVAGRFAASGQRLVHGLYGRKVHTGLRPGTPEHLYLKGETRGVFNGEGALLAAREAGGVVVLCEALLDALTLWRHGIRCVTTALGARGLGADLWRYLTQSGFSRVVLGFDADEAGDAAAVELAPRLAAEGLEVVRLALPRGQDVNALACGSKDAAGELRRAIERATWMSERLYGEAARPLARDPAPAPLPEAVAPPRAPAALPAPAAPASFLAAAPPAPSPPGLVEEGEALAWRSGDRHWRVLGLARLRGLESMRVTLRVARAGHFHLDTLDLYQAKSREAFVRQGASELGAELERIKRDLGELLALLEERLSASLAASRPPEPAAPVLSALEREEALSLLREKGYLLRLLSDLSEAGMVGEEPNKLLVWLALSSRRLESPLGVLIQSGSAAGKSSLLDGILRTMPEEDVVRYSALSGQALFYMAGLDLRHKVLAISEEEGARRASYSLKLLQSEGALSMASTTKDAESGQLVTREYRTEGPVALALTTTNPDLDPELSNRCLVLSVDESREQTEAIQARQRQAQTRPGMLARRQTAARLSLWRNAQRLLEPLDVVNPYACDLGFASHQTRTRRDQAKYLSLVAAVALCHQHQKPIHEDAHGRYIEASLDDIELATLLSAHALGRSLDELPAQTARLWRQLGALVRQAAEREGCEPELYRFTRRWVRERTHWGDTQLKVHLRRLEELELLLVSRGAQGSAYRLALLEESAPGLLAAGLPSLSGLRGRHPLDAYDGTWSALAARWSGKAAPRSEGGREAPRPAAVEDRSPGKADGEGAQAGEGAGGKAREGASVGAAANAYRAGAESVAPYADASGLPSLEAA